MTQLGERYKAASVGGLALAQAATVFHLFHKSNKTAHHRRRGWALKTGSTETAFSTTAWAWVAAASASARVSHFMNKFRELGFIDYNGSMEVHSSLLRVVLHQTLSKFPAKPLSLGQSSAISTNFLPVTFDLGSNVRSLSMWRSVQFASDVCAAAGAIAICSTFAPPLRNAARAIRSNSVSDFLVLLIRLIFNSAVNVAVQ
jgi:hypothetical protein